MKKFDVYYTITGNTTYVHTVEALNAISAKWVAAEEIGREIRILRVVELWGDY